MWKFVLGLSTCIMCLTAIQKYIKKSYNWQASLQFCYDVLVGCPAPNNTAARWPARLTHHVMHSTHRRIDNLTKTVSQEVPLSSLLWVKLHKMSGKWATAL